ncbi:MAG: hypothetical protein RX316_10410 [bacterium]|nr:hypothetical protein [bacterium]
MGKRSTALQATAYHEAGHLLVAWRENITVHSVSIIDNPKIGSAGRVYLRNPLDGARRSKAVTKRSRRRLEGLVRYFLSGALAQKRFNPRSYRRWHDEDDRKQARKIIKRLAGADDETARAALKHLEAQASDMLSEERSWLCVEAIAAALMERKELKAGEVKAIIKQVETEVSESPLSHAKTQPHS